MELMEMKRNEADDCYVFQRPDLFPKAFPIMDEMRSQGKLCDVVLKIEDKSFIAHKIVLASTIPYFQAIFAHDMIEIKLKDISMQGIDSIALECLLNFAYSAKLIIHDKNVQSIMAGAYFLQLNEVKEACANFLCKRFNPQNVLGIRQLSDTLACRSLLKAADKYINQNFHEVSLSDAYLNLSLEDVLDIVERDELDIVSEEQVFEACLHWVKHCDGRVDCLPKLLYKVRLPLLTPLYLMDRVATEELIKTSDKCRDLLDEAYLYKLIPLLQSFNAVPRNADCPSGHIFVVGGTNEDDAPVNTVKYLDLTTLVWKSAPAMSVQRYKCRVAVLNDRLYAIGGFNHHDRYLSSAEVFDPLKKQWKFISPMLQSRKDFSATALGQYIYVCGGCRKGATLKLVKGTVLKLILGLLFYL